MRVLYTVTVLLCLFSLITSFKLVPSFLNNTASSAGKSIQVAYNSTKDTVVNKVPETVKSGAESVKNVYNVTKETVVENVPESVQSTYNDTKITLTETVPKVVNKTVELVAEDTADTVNKTLDTINEYVPMLNGSRLTNFTFSFTNGSGHTYSSSSPTKPKQVDCFGIGKTVATALEFYFSEKPNGTDALGVKFYLSSRKQPSRVSVFLGKQFGLEWTDFKPERRTVFIVHGFMSHGNETWIADLEKAFLRWGDVNVVVVDWAAGSNTWNYYKAAVNTRIVGYQISKLLEHIMNKTLSDNPEQQWGPIHLVGHSLGSHICGYAAKEFKKWSSTWRVMRITGLDPAQPCFKNVDKSVLLHKNDAPLVDIIHTNGRFLSQLGLGMPNPIGHVDFYPNGGKVQPGCIPSDSFFSYLPIPKATIEAAICSHGRSYLYLTESLLSAANHNCTFWAHQWNLTYRHAMQIVSEPCNRNNCVEMGINVEQYSQRGTFFAATDSTPPYCSNGTSISDEVLRQLQIDHQDELED